MKNLSQHITESFEAFAAFSHDDMVNFYPMFRHQQEFGISGEETFGRIVSIKFSKAKVFYTIVDDYFGHIFDDVDSSNVWKEQPLDMPLEES